MNHQDFVDAVDMPCCVMSVQKTEEGACGEIRIVVSNQAYKNVMGPKYYDNMPYSELVPKDNKFEDFCFRAAILKQRMHAYVETKALHWWVDQTLIPLSSDREDMGFCQFIFEFTSGPDADRMASVSVNTAGVVIKACIKLMGADDFRESVSDVLRDILTESGAMACRIMLVDHENKKAVVYCDQTEDERWTIRENEVITYGLISTWEDMIGVSNAVIVKDEQDLSALQARNPAWAHSMRSNGVKSLVLIPLRRDSSVIGYLYVVNFNVSRVVEIKEMLELLSFFLGSEIYNHLLVKKLEEISQIDALTGLKNRRAMIQRVRALSGSAPRPCYGVINIDLNGLKRVNDREGHEAGDRLIIQAGELLGKVFYHDDIFRTGGDEFVIVIGSIEREIFERKVSRLRASAEKHSASFAIGSYWSDGTADLTDAFRFADEMMYADKKAFYDRHPNLQRK